MTFTYTDAQPTALQRVRHDIGDTDSSRPLRSDETINAVLVVAGTVGTATEVTLAEKVATAELASALAVEYAQRPDSIDKPGKIAVSWRDRVKAWQALATRLYGEVAAASVATSSTVGAQSVAAIRGDVDGYSEYVRESNGGRNWFTE